MAKYYNYSTNNFITDSDATIVSTFGSVQVSTTVVRDGSFDTNFKNAQLAHRDAFLSLSPSTTSPPCFVSATGKWIKIQPSATVVSAAATINVPVGNSGKMKVFFDIEDTATVKYKIAAGSWTSISSGTEITLTNGQTLSFEGLTMAEQEFLNGVVTDSDTGVDLDSISLMNNTPAP